MKVQKNQKIKLKFISKLYVVLFLLFMYVPLFVLIVFSFNESKSRSVWTGFTLTWYNKLLHNREILHSALNTLIVASAASAIATVIGTVSAVGIHFLKRRWKQALMTLTSLPIMNPEIVTGVSLMLLFTFLKLKMGFATLIMAHIAFNVPYVIFNVMPKLEQMDRHLCYAAFSLDDFIISYFNSGPTSQTLPLAIFAMTRRKVSPEINAISTIIFVAALIIILVVNGKEINKKKRGGEK